MSVEALVGPESTFLDECMEHLNLVEDTLIRGAAALDEESVNRLFRSFHSIKGAAEIFGHEHAGRFTHCVESVLVQARDGMLTVDERLSSLLLESADHVRRLLSAGAAVASSDAELKEQTARIIEDIESIGGISEHSSRTGASPTSAPESAGLFQIRLRCGPDLFSHSLDPLPVLRYLAEHGTLSNLKCLVDDVPDTEDFQPEKAYLGFLFDFETAQPAVLEDAFEFIREDCTIEVHSVTQVEAGADTALDAPPAQRTSAKDAKIPEIERRAELQSRTFRVEAEKIDGLVDLVGELVTSGAEIGQLAGILKSELLAEAGHRLARTIAEIRDRSLRLRMVPMEMLFSRLRRTVHDTAQTLGKRIHFKTRGGETEFDRTLVERVTDPLMHIVRNAVDHAIEDEMERATAGKKAEGLLEVAAYNEGGDVVIEIRDDGRGLSRDKILARAVSKGLLQKGAVPSDEDILNLIFAPGFSTAQTVTQISGRGVGLDVARRNIESLGGTVEVSTDAGAGSVFTVRLPLTLATIDGFMVGLGGVRYVIPMDIVKECIKFTGGSERDFVNVRGDIVPFADLRKLLGFTPAEPAYLVIVHADRQLIGLVVDEILGESQTVVKPLGFLRNQTRGLSGFSVLGSGEVAPILDIPAICALAKEKEQWKLKAKAH